MFFYPNRASAIPPGDQLRVRHRRINRVGWTRATTSDRSVLVDFDGDRHATLCTWADLENEPDLSIPDMPANVVRLPTLFRGVEGGP